MGLTYRNRGLALWVRVGLYAQEHAGPDRTVTLKPRQLLRALDETLILQPSSVSRAINTAVARGVLDPTSTARRLVVK